jgi:carboxylesterase type B
MWYLLSAVVILTASSTSAKIVDTLYGQVDGNTVTLDDGIVVNSWYGIPFARAPVGELRFEVCITVELRFS